MQTSVLLAITLMLGQSPAAPDTAAARSSTPAQNDILQMQVMLDRAGFSPGAIDGRMGPHTRKAQELFQRSGRAAAAVQPLTTYRITADDAAGPFVERIPHDMMELATLPALGYTSLTEALAERFHTTPAFLQELNPGTDFAAGQDIRVPNVEPLTPPAPPPPGSSAADTGPPKPDVTVTVTRASSAVTVTDADGRIVFYAPVTTGSEHDPLPLGEWKVTGVQFNPKFHYNPDLFWDAEASHSKATIAAGPNNPVGLVWVDISKEHYGLHGTPEPASIGLTQSHGCVRLTNWDAVKLASLVKPGTRVRFTK